MLIHANSLDSFPLADKSVQMVCTSPPYFALRDYEIDGQLGLEPTMDCLGWATGAPCGECYVCHLVTVFREVWRVLRDDGIAFLNLGDSYATDQKGSGGHTSKQSTNKGSFHRVWNNSPRQDFGVKHKDMCGIPWRVAFALQADGWYLRSDIIWSKPNPMPESVTDRPTKAHEYLFLLAKQERYYYDAEAVKEPAQEWTGQAARFERTGPVSEHVLPGQSAAQRRPERKQDQVGKRQYTGFNERWDNSDQHSTRNRRSVWTVATAPFAGAHFATFPPALVEPCILAGTSAHGNCSVCGAPWERVVEKNRSYDHVTTQPGKSKIGPYASQTGNGEGTHDIRHGAYSNSTTTGWRPTCHCVEIYCTMCDFVLQSGNDRTNAYMLPLRQEILEQEEGQPVLQPDLLRHSAGDQASQLSKMRQEIHPQGQSGDVLREGLLQHGNGKGAAQLAGLVQDEQGLHPHLHSIAPERYADGICDATPACDGEGDRSATDGDRSGASQERSEGRQSPRKSGSPRKGKSRRDTQAALHGDVPPLQSDIPRQGQCPHCRAPLSVRVPSTVPAIILDPFAGSGTTGQVARLHGRRFVGLDLNATYLRDLALPRAEGRQTAASMATLPLFALEVA